MGSIRAVDTNILARYVTADDAVQTPLATAILASPCYVSDTVFLELAWLLSSRYRIPRADLAAILSDIVHLPTVTVSDSELILWATGRFAAGADFADMMHMISGRGSDSFVSFEKELDILAGPDAPLPIERPI